MARNRYVIVYLEAQWKACSSINKIGLCAIQKKSNRESRRFHKAAKFVTLVSAAKVAILDAQDRARNPTRI